MLPFVRMLEYGNSIPNWYNGTELIAWDSYIFDSSGFLDYLGNPIMIGGPAAGASGVPILASSSDIDSPYGKMVDLGFNSYIGTRNGVVDCAKLSSSFSIDFWVLCTNSVGQFPSMNILLCLSDITINDSSSRQYITFESDGRSLLANNNTIGYGKKNWNTELQNSYHHFAIQYNSNLNMIYYFLNGILQDSVSFTFTLNLMRKDIAISSRFTTGNKSYIDRYRLKEGINFNSTGFNISTIYPLQ